MVRRSLQIGIAVLFMCSSRSLTAAADPILPRSALLSITSGELRFEHFSDDPIAQGVLLGPNFSLTPLFLFGVRNGGPDMDLSSVAVGTLTIDGAELVFDTFQVEGHLTPDGPQRIIIERPFGDEQFLERRLYPFTLTAALFGVHDDIAYRYELRGRGRGETVAIGGFSDDPNEIRDQFTRLDFGNVAPTPEPSTLLLIGLGLGILAAPTTTNRPRRRPLVVRA
jgi:PEP-CTERM motif-containing protein